MTDQNRRTRLMVGEAPSPSHAATATERNAVDQVLADFVPFERTQLLPLLRALQMASSSLSKGLLGYLSERTRVPFAELYGVASFYALLDTGLPHIKIRVCNGVPCVLSGAEELGGWLERQTGLASGQTGQNGSIVWEWFPCIGQCDRAPAMLLGDEAVYGVDQRALSMVLNRATHADD